MVTLERAWRRAVSLWNELGVERSEIAAVGVVIEVLAWVVHHVQRLLDRLQPQPRRHQRLRAALVVVELAERQRRLGKLRHMSDFFGGSKHTNQHPMSMAVVVGGWVVGDGEGGGGMGGG